MIISIIAGALPSVVPMPAGAANYPVCSSSQAQNCLYNGFEMDGDTPVNGGGVDWDSNPFPYPRTDFVAGQGTDNPEHDYKMGSHYTDQTSWSCDTSDVAPPKDELISGSAALGTFGSHQVAFLNFTRQASGGNTYYDFVFSKGKVPANSLAGCPQVPTRQNGDTVITMFFAGSGQFSGIGLATWDTSLNNGAGAFKCVEAGTTAPSCVSSANFGTDFAAAQSASGTFIEGALDFANVGLGSFTCHEFGSLYIDSRSSGSGGTSEMKDFIAPEVPNLCQSPTVTTHTTPSGSTVALDTAASDTATVTGVAGSGDPAAGASVEFSLCGPRNGMTPASATTGCLTGGTDVGAGTAGTTGVDGSGNPVVTYTSPSFTNVDTVGLYCWRADYTASPTGNYNDASHTNNVLTGAGAECFNVVPNSPVATTHVKDGQNANTSSIEIGGSAHDTATLTGATSDAGGTLTYYLYTGNACDSSTPSMPTGTLVTGFGTSGADTVNVTDGSVPASAAYQFNTAGNYQWIVHYSGDARNNGAWSTCGSEPLQVTTPDSSLHKQEKDVTHPDLTMNSGGFTDGPIAAQTGDVLQYQLVYHNGGNAPAHNVTVTDTIPAHSTYVASSCTGGSSCGINSGVITWNLGTVNAGGANDVTLGFQVTLDSVFPTGTTQVSNFGVWSNTEEGSNHDSNTVIAVVGAGPSSTLHKQEKDLTHPDLSQNGGGFTDGPINASPGDVLEYQLVYENAGNANATNVVVLDDIPAHTTYVASSCTGGVSCSGLGTVEWHLGTVAPGVANSVTLTFKVTLDAVFPAGVTKVFNHGTVLSDGETGHDSNIVEADVTAAPDSSLHKQERDVTTDGSYSDGPITANTGDVLQYKLVYDNSGNAPASNVTVTDVVPTAHGSYVDGSCTGGSSCGYDSGTHTITWHLGTVQPGQANDVTMTFKLQLDAVFPAGTTQISNAAVVTTTEEGSINSNTVVANVTAAPKSSLVKSERDVTADGEFSAGPITANPGDTLEYQLVYDNSGDAAATNVTVTDVVPTAHASYVASSCTGGSSCSYDGGTHTITWNLGTIQPGAANDVTMTFQILLQSTFPAGTTSIDNVGVYSTDQGGGNSNTVVANVSAAPISALHKQERDVTAGGTFSDGPITAQPGDTLEYQLAYTNSGDAPATNVTITDTVPASTTFVSCSNSCTNTAGTLTWDLGTVDPGSVAVTFQVKLAATYPVGTTKIDNAAVVATDQGGGTSNTVEATVTVAQGTLAVTLPKAGEAFHALTTSPVFRALTSGPGGSGWPLWPLVLGLLAVIAAGIVGVDVLALRRRS